MGVKVAVVGGGSTYTPELVEGFVTRGDRLPVDELALLDIDAERLAVVGGARRTDAAARGMDGPTRPHRRPDRGPRGRRLRASCSSVSGGQAARFPDETIPPRYGCIGQETTGPGGFAKALRTVPVVLELAEETASAAPRARGSSTSRTRPASSRRPCSTRDTGRSVCATSRSASSGGSRQHFGVEPERVQLEHVGLNHLTWERRVLVDGVDRLPEILEDAIDLVADETDMPADADPGARRDPQLLPALLLPREPRSSSSRNDHADPRRGGHGDRGGAARALPRIPALDTKPKLLEERGGAFYSRRGRGAGGLAPRGHRRRAGREHPQRRRDPGPARRRRRRDRRHDRPATARTPCPWRRSRPTCSGSWSMRRPTSGSPIEAAMTGDRDVALRALMTNPLVGDFDVAAPAPGGAPRGEPGPPAAVLPGLLRSSDPTERPIIGSGCR